jgi:hypothetical protein
MEGTKMRNKIRYSYPVLALLMLTSLVLDFGCAKKESFDTPPFIPGSYYNCIEAATYEIAFSYWSPYSMRLKDEGSPIPGEAYRDMVFVVKGYPLTDWSLKDVDKGYVMIDMIKCYPLESMDFSRLKAGTMVDMVGVNKGPEQENYTDFSEGILVFTGCVIMPAGSVQLPAEGQGGQIPVYPSY